jgi:putative DNA primase/helicase
MLKPINVLPEQFLSCFFEPGDSVCLRVFDDRKASTFKGAKLECEAGRFRRNAPKA